jgi:hypothetical protein
MAPDWNLLNDPDLIGFLFEGLEDHAVGEEALASEAGAFADTVQRGVAE